MTYQIEAGGRVAAAGENETLLSVLRGAGVPGLEAPCGGRGRCGKCLVRVTGRVRLPDGSEAQLCGGTVRACGTFPLSDCRVEVAGAELDALRAGAVRAFETDGEAGLGAAVDIGTTTVAAYLYELNSGALLASAGGANVQRAFGADVISRIHYADTHPGGLEQMSRAVRAQISGLAGGLLASAGRAGGRLRRVSVAGNTIMQHIFCGLSPHSIGVAPYAPLSLFGELLADGGPEFGPGAELYLAPCVSGYVGGDVTAGLYAGGASEEPCLYADIGTNGELALGGPEGFLCCAAAAGPAFEGAEISCGMSGSAGAVSSVRLGRAGLELSVIGGGQPLGVCGSGLIDALAVMLELGAVDETGRLLPPWEAPAAARGFLSEDEDEGMLFSLAEGVWITEKDVRKLQLAKAAMRAGIEVLLAERGLTAAQVPLLCLAGGFGSLIDTRSAVRIGLLPAELLGRTRVLGNAAGMGASAALLSAGARSGLLKLRDRCAYLELSGHRGFTDAFMDAMTFEE